MPSNPEQLLGAILVRKDIFQRFETTMHDTCLDANNLLEYLFSLYNSTASPAERDNFPSPHGFNFIQREPNHGKRGSGQWQRAFPYQSSMVSSHLLQPPAFQSRFPDADKEHKSSQHQKKIKLGQTDTQEHVNPTAQHQKNIDSTSSVKSNLVFPNVTINPALSSEMELKPHIDSLLRQSSTSLSPLNKNHNQISRPFSPASGHCSDVPTTPLDKDSFNSVGTDFDEEVSGNIKIEFEDPLPGVILDKKTPDSLCGSSKQTKKGKKRDSRKKSAEANDGRYGGRKRKIHECFCGAVFTRADNLKRHIRKCHEEKREKLNAIPLGLESDSNNNGEIPSLSQAIESPAQNGRDSSQPVDTNECHQLRISEHSNQLLNNQQDSADVKSAPSVRWSCFCGECFDDQCQLVEHTRTHDDS